jgi:hypothetical protein
VALLIVQQGSSGFVVSLSEFSVRYTPARIYALGPLQIGFN